MAANHIKFILPIILLASCFSRSSMMTYSEYDQVEVGTPVATLRSEVGKPYAVHEKKDGTQEYEYIERINSGNNLFAENHYFLIVKEGKVIGKRMKREGPPAYDLIYQEEPNYQTFP